ncbi:MAG: nucleotidyltransferase domain-containing protein [Candidatus Brocadiae bacterium]|nr:nucleotidyltransferase domain-containing protein [Candidatus Brocadiia bacterium]
MLDALFSGTRQQILTLFLMRPEERHYLREVARLTGRAVGTVQAELASLARAGILSKVPSGNRTYYQANTDCSIFPELRGVILKTAGLTDILRGKLQPLADNIEASFIYGSMASGEADGQSDVDLMVIGEVDETVLHEAISEAETELGRAVNYILMASGEFHRRGAETGGFIQRVLAGPRLLVIGGPQ